MRRLGQNRAGTHAGGGNPPDAAVWRGTQTDPDPGVTISVRYRLRPVRRLALVAPVAPLSSLMATPEHSSSYLPFQQFQALFNSLFKVLCIFPSRYLFAIGLSLVFSLRRNLPPILSCSPKQPDSSRTLRTHQRQPRTGLSPSMVALFQGTCAGASAGCASIDYNSETRRVPIFKLSSSRFTRRY